MNHAVMRHDMSDLGMAAAMERDMHTKFIIALPLTSIIVAVNAMLLRGVERELGTPSAGKPAASQTSP